LLKALEKSNINSASGGGEIDGLQN
jgi:hypothetical protein